MDATSTGALVTGAISTFGTEGLAILTSVIGIAVALLIFRWGWRKLHHVAK